MKRLACVFALLGALLIVTQSAQAHPYCRRPAFYGPAVVYRPPVVAYRPYVAYRAPVVVAPLPPPVYGGVYYRGPAYYGPPVVGPGFGFSFGYGYGW